MWVYRIHVTAIGALAACLVGLPIAAASPAAVGLPPTTNGDTPATYIAAPSPVGAADCGSPFDACSLTTAINSANANPTSTIELLDGTFTGGLPGISVSTTLKPFAGASPTIGTGTSATAIQFNAVGGTLHVTGLTFTGSGGGILVDQGNAIVDASSFGNNTFYGVSVSGSATITDSAFTGANYGVTATGGMVTVASSTFNGPLNGIHSGPGASVSIRSSTMVGGTRGAYADGGSVTIGGSILAGSTFNCTGTVTDAGGNIGSDNSCGLSPANGSVSNSATIAGSLAPLADYGGPTKTMALLEGSPALGLVPATVVVASTAACTGSDQRGLPRPSGPCDAGAYQTQPTLYAAPGGNGDCTAPTPATDECDLTTAVTEVAPGGTVRLDGGTYTGKDAELTVNLPVTLRDLPGTAAVLSAASGTNAITVMSNAALTVIGLTLQGPSDSYGIDNTAGDALTVADSTLSGFSLGVIQAAAPVTVVDSTLTDNGYAVFEQSATSVASVFDSTLTGNDFGVAQLDGSAILGGDIIAGNGQDCGTGGDPLVVTDAGGNIDGDGSCGFSAANGSVSSSATIAGSLHTLGNYGGPTATVSLAPDSPAIGLVTGNLGVGEGCDTPDQRAVARPIPSCDAGAFQTAPPTITSDISSATAPHNGWYTTPVTVSFTCTPGGQPLDGSCPSPVILSTSGAAQTVTRSIAGTDGESTDVTAGPINIDRDSPLVQIRGAKAGKVYGAPTPTKVSCHATDALSGLAGACKLTTHHHGTKVTVTATATDIAGNTTTSHLKFGQLAFFIAHAKYAHGRFAIQRGHKYTVTAYLPSGSQAPTYLTAARGSKPGDPQAMTLASPKLWSIRTTIAPKSSHTGKWTAAIKVGSHTHPLKLTIS